MSKRIITQKMGKLHTHSGFNKKEKNQSFTAEGDNSKLNMCVELIDSRENGERFFLRNYNHLKGKVAIFKEVEFWDLH